MSKNVLPENKPLLERPKYALLMRSVSSEQGAQGTPSRVSVTASSDEVDLGNDRFTVNALTQMRDAFASGMTIFLNHVYKIPDDVFGRVVSAELIQREGRTDLDLVIEVDESNPRAQAAFRQIQAGIALGVSVGVLVLSAKKSAEKVNGQTVLDIDSVFTLEASVVGIPANRRGWTHGEMKAASLELRNFFAQDEDGGADMALDNDKNDEVSENLDTEAVSENPDIVEDDAPEGAAETDVEDEGNEESGLPSEDEGDEDEAEVDPEEEAEPAPDPAPEEEAEPAEEESEAEDYSVPEVSSRAEFAAYVRQKFADPNRKWFEVKDAEGDDADDSVAEVKIYDAIGGDPKAVQDFVDAIEAIKASRINLHLNTPGGIITDGIAMRNALARHPADVYVYVDGLAASMGSVIAMVGKEVIMGQDSMLMIHEPWGCAMGDAEDMQREANLLDKFGNQLAGSYKRKGGGMREQWRDYMKAESWFTAEEAVDVGLADRVEDFDGDKEENKKFDEVLLKAFKNVPENVKTAFFAPAKTSSVEPHVAVVEVNTKDFKNVANALKAANDEVERLKGVVAEKDDEIEGINVAVEDFLKLFNQAMDLPLPRKIAPEDTFEDLSVKYPYLDSRILAQLARTISPNG